MIDKLTIPLNGTNTDISIDSQSIIFLWANWSWKTRLWAWIEKQSGEEVYRISAQKSLSFPESITKLWSIENAVKDLYYWNPSYWIGNREQGRWGAKPETHLLNDYSKLLSLLFSEYLKETSDFTEGRIAEKPITKLHTIKEIWEKIIPHRELIIAWNAINVSPREGSTGEYSAQQMSDGERVIFYLIGQAISAPWDSIIIIDEPELHLHKSIQDSLWKEIEMIRKDCLFAYFSHDVDFVSSKIEAKKIWLKSYDWNTWDWEEYNHSDWIPNELELEIIWTRQKVLFVEWDNGSLDIELYKNVFHNFLVKPVWWCKNVINYTKSFRANTSFTWMTFFWLIDKDRIVDAEILSLKWSWIYTLEVAEIENIFIIPELLDIISDSLSQDKDQKRLEVKNSVITALNSELEHQVSLRAKEEIKFQLSLFNLEPRSRDTLSNSLKNLKDGIIFEDIYDTQKTLFDTIISEWNYCKIIGFYNRKTLSSTISWVFGLASNELQKMIIRKLSDETTKKLIIEGVKKYIPVELISEI